MNIKIDETTGLPEVPDGYWWSVTADADKVMVWLDWKGRGLWDDSINRIEIPHYRLSGDSIHPEKVKRKRILRAAKRVYKRMFRTMYGGGNCDFVGTYPPKSLNDR